MEYICITYGCTGTNAPPIFFLPKNSFFEEGQIKKYKYFLNYYFGSVKVEKMKNLHFMGCRIEAS